MPERRLPGPDSAAATITAFPPAKEIASQVRVLAAEFDRTRATLEKKEGFDNKRLPFAVKLGEMTQTHLDGIAALFDTTPTPHVTLGLNEQTIAIPGTDKRIIFYTSPEGQAKGSRIFPSTILLPKRTEEEDRERFMQILSADARDARNIVVVLGADSVSFVQKPYYMDQMQPHHLIATISPKDGLYHTVDPDHILLQDSRHAINLAKAITLFNPDITRVPKE